MGEALPVFAAVVTFKRPECVRVMLEAVCRQTRVPDHVLVIDNGGEPAVEAIVDDFQGRLSVSYHRMSGNLGPAGGIAWAMRETLGRVGPDGWLWLLDDDNPPWHDEVLGALYTFGEQQRALDPKLAAVGCAGSRFDFRTGRVNRVPNAQIAGAVPVTHIGGGQFPMYRVAAIREVGTFDASIFWGFEELEYGLRLGAAGFRLLALGELWLARRTQRGRLDHDDTPDLRMGGYSWRRFYTLRNLIHILCMHGHPRVGLEVAVVRGVGKPLLNLPLAPARSVRALRWNARAIVQGLTGHLGRTVEPADLPLR